MRSFLISGSAVLLLGAGVLEALPVDPTVANGSAEINQPSSKEMQIQLSDSAVVNWKSFSIGEGESVHLQLPSEASKTLQRVTGMDISEINGLLQSNGRVFLINPNGILIGPDGKIDVADFTASTLDLDDLAFLEGKELLLQGFDAGDIIHYGKIQAATGSIALIGMKIENYGRLKAPEGQISIGSGERLVFKPEGEQRIFIQAPLTNTSKERGIYDAGKMQALQVELKSCATPYTYAIRQKGTIEALSTRKDQAGRVFLVSDGGKIMAEGTIRAPEGEIHLVADKVFLTGVSTFTTSGPHSGGAIYVGFDAQKGAHGRGSWVGSRVSLQADALQSGDGGTVKIYGENVASVRGTISAQGGALAGDGGLVEFSTGGYLGFNSRITTESAHGKIGNLILDPNDIEITVAPNSTWPSIGTLFTGEGVARAQLDVNDLIEALNTNNVTVMTDVRTEGGRGDIYLLADIPNAPSVWTAPTTLRLQAHRNIYIDKEIVTPGRLEFYAGQDVYIRGAITSTYELSTPALDLHAEKNLQIENVPVHAMTDIYLYGGEDVKMGEVSLLKEPISETVSLYSELGDIMIRSFDSSVAIPCTNSRHERGTPPGFHHNLEMMTVANSEIFYRVAWLEDQVIQLPFSLLYDRGAYFGKNFSSYRLNLDSHYPYLRQNSANSEAETTPFDYSY